MSSGIVVEGLTKRFGDFTAVDDVSFTADEGKITALLGPSGSGKSTVLRVLAGLETPDSGRISVGDQEITGTSVQDRRFGFVFQHYALFRHMTVAQNVGFALTVRHEPRDVVRRRVDRAAGAGPADAVRRPLSGSAVRRSAAAGRAGEGAGCASTGPAA